MSRDYFRADFPNFPNYPNYLVIFLGLFGLLSALVAATVYKYLPLLLARVIRYCQSLGHSVSFQIPNQLGSVLLVSLSLLILLVVIQLIFSYLRVHQQRKSLHRRTVRHTEFESLVKKLRLAGKVFLVTDSKPFAFCLGFLHPKIYVSSRLLAMLTPIELEAVLRHERCHLKKHDALILLVAQLTRSLFPFFPLIVDLTRNYRLTRELAADHEAVLGLGDAGPLLAVLRKILHQDHQSHQDQGQDPSLAYTFAIAIAVPDTLEQRIRTLVSRRATAHNFRSDHYYYSYRNFRNFRLRNVVVSLASLLILSSLVVLPVYAVTTPEQENEVAMVCLQPNSCGAWCSEHQSVKPPVESTVESAVESLTESSIESSIDEPSAQPSASSPNSTPLNASYPFTPASSVAPVTSSYSSDSN